MLTLSKFFFDKYNKLHLLIDFILNSENKTDSLELYVATQIQLVEIYGNLKSRRVGKKTKKDIKLALSKIPDKAFDLIFIHYYKTRNSIPCLDIFGDISKTKCTVREEVNKYRSVLEDNLMELRNFIIHPCRGGALKKAEKENIYDFWCCLKTHGLNYRAISQLSVSLNKMIRFLILQEIGLENYFYKENE